MKQFWFYKDVLLWSMLFIAAVLVPRLALSEEPCEAKASPEVQKKSVEIEMALISGELSELEVVTQKESLLREARLEKDKCRRALRAARAPVAASQASSL